MKHVGVIADPAISTYTLSDNDVFFIVASDGIWEFIESKNAVDLCKDLVQKDDATGACRELILEAAAKWNEEEGDYRDDITCMVVRVNPLDHAAASPPATPCSRPAGTAWAHYLGPAAVSSRMVLILTAAGVPPLSRGCASTAVAIVSTKDLPRHRGTSPRRPKHLGRHARPPERPVVTA